MPAAGGAGAGALVETKASAFVINDAMKNALFSAYFAKNKRYPDGGGISAMTEMLQDILQLGDLSARGQLRVEFYQGICGYQVTTLPAVAALVEEYLDSVASHEQDKLIASGRQMIALTGDQVTALLSSHHFTGAHFEADTLPDRVSFAMKFGLMCL